jgi:DNA-binding CsgD family transcriptional regulator
MTGGPFGLSNATDVRAIIAEAAFKDITIYPEVKTIQFPSPQEFVLRYVAGSALAGAVANAGAVLVRHGVVHGCACVSRSPRDGDFEQAHLDLFALLMPHLQRAAQVYAKLASAQRERADALVALERFQLGVLMVATDWTVCYANPEAEAILAQADGLRIERGKLRASAPRAMATMHQMLVSTIAGCSDPLVQTARTAMPDGLVRIERPSARRPLALLIVPLPRRSAIWPIAVPVASVIIFVTDPERQTAQLPETLRRVYGLTPREASIAAGIAKGSRLTDVADQLGIASATARTHLLRVFAKTDTCRQADLAQLIGRLAAVARL